jgi:energy-coupling factor transport system permease protein
VSILEGLRFTTGDTFLHKLDPRVKFLLTLIIFFSAILFLDLIPLLTIFIIQIPLIFLGKIQREWMKTLRGGIVLAMIILITNLLSFYFFHGRTITGENIEYSLALTLRFIVLITSFSLFFLTTSPDKLSLTLEKFNIPYEFNFAFITAIRFVPVLAEEAQTIMDAQRTRGLELDKGSIFDRVRKYIPVLLPLIINSIRRSLELAEAMESRAFASSEKRTNLYELKMTSHDYVVLVLLLAIIIFILYIKFFFPPFPNIIPRDIVIRF